MCIENVPKNINVEIEGEDMTVYIQLADGHWKKESTDR
jgi:hypothetical protein